MLTFITALILGSPGHADGQKHPSYLELDGAATLLMVISDGAVIPTSCAIESKNALKLLQPLHALIDKEQDDMASQYLQRKISTTTIEGWSKTCQTGCHCGFYSSLFEKIGDKIRKGDRLFFQTITSKAQSQSQIQAGECAKKIIWFCKSPLKREIEDHK
jgi:hypothetical protein